MALSGTTLVRLIDGTDVALSDLPALAPQASIAVRVFAVQRPQEPTTISGRTFPGLVVGHEAFLPRVTRRESVVVDVVLSTGDVVRCAPTQLLLTMDGVWAEAGRFNPGVMLRPLVTDIEPITNPDLLPQSDITPGVPGGTGLIFPEISVVSVSMAGVEDLWELWVPGERNYGLASRVFAQAA